MDTKKYIDYLLVAIKAAVLAGEEILKIYASSFSVELKEDRSPLTAADKASHLVIGNQLTDFGYPILSEEGLEIDFEQRKHWTNYWCVDPLDGTKEFIRRNGEFTVNIAFMENKSPLFGIIFQPTTGELYAGFDNVVYFIMAKQIDELTNENLNSFRLKINSGSESQQIKVVASRSHLSSETQDFIDSLKANGSEVSIVNAGSALKFCLLAKGQATIYPRFAPTMEWDTAAGHAILKACGKNIYLSDSNVEMTYNKPSLVNDWFVAR